jgi:uncharacterized SAM-binding protein YcdF (DUF218 family)
MSKKEKVKRPERTLGCFSVVFLVVVVLVVFGSNLLELHARWLAVEGEPTPSDAILVLGGGRGERLHHALRLYREGFAPEIFITGPAEPILPQAYGADGLTQAEAKRLIAIENGVPEEKVTVILGPTSTHEEATVTLSVFRDLGYERVLVVTSPFHARRARQTFRKVCGKEGVRVTVLHTPWAESSYDPKRWWRRELDTFAVLVETAKLVYYLFRYGVSPV